MTVLSPLVDPLLLAIRHLVENFYLPNNTLNENFTGIWARTKTQRPEYYLIICQNIKDSQVNEYYVIKSSGNSTYHQA